MCAEILKNSEVCVTVVSWLGLQGAGSEVGIWNSDEHVNILEGSEGIYSGLALDLE